MIIMNKIQAETNSKFPSPQGDGLGVRLLSISIQHAMLTTEGKTNLEIDTVISDNELLCLFGHSGAGKTTLLRILAGLTKPDKGRITFDDQVWFDSDKKINLSPQQRNVGFMFQDYALFPNMSVEQNIRFAQKTKNAGEVDNLISLFDLQPEKTDAAKLSGGQKQRVALAVLWLPSPMCSCSRTAIGTGLRHAFVVATEIGKAHRLTIR